MEWEYGILYKYGMEVGMATCTSVEWVVMWKGVYLDGRGTHWKIFMALRCWMDQTMMTPPCDPDAKKEAAGNVHTPTSDRESS